ncbi:MAG: PD-(D/E)XK nuclease family protein [Gammaproteobacteria bacterium]|nr:PD-(D/E)XK nuclease family protein [Gammaproteobacteria bacterium]
MTGAGVRGATSGRAPLVPLHDSLDDAIRRGTVITPNRRLARELTYAVDCDRRLTSATWSTPDILAIDPFLERCYRECQDAGLPGADALLLPERILPFALARAVPDPAWLRHVDTFADAWRIAKLYGLASADPRLRDTENGRAYARWAGAFEGLLEAEGWMTNAQLPDRLVRLMDGPSGWRPPVGAALGFDEPATAIRRFLTASKTPSLALSRGTAARSLKLVATTSQRQDDRPTGDAGVEELALAAQWARERLAEDPGARIGVVVAGLGPAFAAIERRFHAAWPDVAAPQAYVNVSGGLALGQEPICRDALEVLAFAADGLDHLGLTALAASPYLDLRLPSRSLRRARLDDLADIPVLRRLRTAVDTAQRSRAWAAAVRRILESVGWPATALSSRETLAVQEFEDCLRDFDRGVEVGAVPTWATAVDALRRLVNTRLFAPLATGQAPIQVLGRAESIGLAFDHLWLAGMHQDGWPPVPEPNPWLPLAVQRAAGVPGLSLDQEGVRAEHMTTHWRQAARHVVASFTAESDKRGARLPSGLVRDFEPVAVSEILRQPDRAAHGHPWAKAREVELVDYVDAAASRLQHGGGETQPGGAAVLQDQSLCPFRAWARHRVGLREDTVRDRFPTEGERGALVHRVLAELCRRHPAREDLTAVGEGEIAGVVETTLPSDDWPAAYRQRECARLTALVFEWLTAEVRRAQFVVASVEEAAEVDIGGLKLNLRIDRLDQVLAGPQAGGQTTGGNLLIDFKTGPVSINHWRGPRPEDPQLPLYAMAARTPVHGVAFARVRPQECRLSGVADRTAVAGRFVSVDDFDATSFEDLLGQWRETLAGLAERFKAGDATVDPLKPTVCRRCHLHALCRVFA